MLASAKSGVRRGLVSHIEMGGFQPLVILHLGRQAAFQDAADQKRTFDWVRRPAGLKHLFDSMHQARRIGHVGLRGKQKLRRLDCWHIF